jgi:uncharacterized protein
MSPVELMRVLVFLGVVAGTYVLAVRVLILATVRHLGKRAEPQTRMRIWADRLVLSTAGAGLVCMIYGWQIEPYWPEVSRVSIESAKLRTGSPPLRIVHISDLHCDPKVRLERRIPELIRRERPDVIVFTGDAINSPSGLPTFQRLMTELAAVAPTFAVRGNWDTWFWNELDLYAATGVKELNDEAVRLEIRGVSVSIAGERAGTSDPRGVGHSLRAISTDDFRLFLYHYPDAIELLANRGADLYCAGHLHGGQVALPFYGALVTLSRYGKRYERGLHRVRETWLYVNRGIGMEGGRAPRVRFCSRPEITVIEVTAAATREGTRHANRRSQ